MKFATRASEDIPHTLAEETQSSKFSLMIMPAPIPQPFEEAILQMTGCSLLVIHVKKRDSDMLPLEGSSSSMREQV
jgi:hypothetical protein